MDSPGLVGTLRSSCIDVDSRYSELNGFHDDGDLSGGFDDLLALDRCGSLLFDVLEHGGAFLRKIQKKSILSIHFPFVAVLTYFMRQS